jgi:hypothetical protein
MGSARLPLESVSYAKNPEHERFVLGFKGRIKARYNVAFLVGAGLTGGAELRASIEAELGNPKYGLDDWVDARDAILVLDRCIRAGVSVERVGELVLPAYKRAHPQVFEGKTVINAFEILEAAYRADTSYGGVSPGLVASAGRATVYRRDSPLPCDYFVGVIRGLLTVFGVRGTVREVECQWEGAQSCTYATTWAT